MAIVSILRRKNQGSWTLEKLIDTALLTAWRGAVAAGQGAAAPFLWLFRAACAPQREAPRAGDEAREGLLAADGAQGGNGAPRDE